AAVFQRLQAEQRGALREGVAAGRNPAAGPTVACGDLGHELENSWKTIVTIARYAPRPAPARAGRTGRIGLRKVPEARSQAAQAAPPTRLSSFSREGEHAPSVPARYITV